MPLKQKMNIDAISKKVGTFPCYLVFELKNDYYIRIMYFNTPEKLAEEKYILYELSDIELQKLQKKHIVNHLMRRLKYKFSFHLSETDFDDRFYIKVIKNLKQLKKNLLDLYLLIDQEIGIIDRSEPKVFFDDTIS